MYLRRHFSGLRALRAAFCLALPSLALLLTGCQNGTTDESDTQSVSENEAAVIMDGNYPASTDYVKILGRYFFWQDTLWLSLSASGIEFQYTDCTECTITLTGDSTVFSEANADRYARYAVYLNDELIADELMSESSRTISVFTASQPESGTVRILKLSESSDSSLGISGIQVDGTISPASAKPLKLEFVGDSITCGYGVDDALGGVYSTSNEDATKTYAYKTAAALDADYSMVCYSGYGVISGYTSGDTPNTYSLLPTYYDKIGNSYGTIMSGIQTGTLRWDFDNYTPDYIIINLGTNDSSYCGTYSDRQEEFTAGYISFLKTLRENNPEAYFVCTLGIMGDTLYPAIETAIADYSEETGDTHISSMKFDAADASDGYAVDYHPTEATHEKAAEKLTAFLQELIE